MGEIPLCTYSHRDSKFSIIRCDVIAYGTAYLIGSTIQAAVSSGLSLREPPRLKVTFKASDGANEQRLKIRLSSEIDGGD